MRLWPKRDIKETYMFRGPPNCQPRRVQVTAHVKEREMTIEAIHSPIHPILQMINSAMHVRENTKTKTEPPHEFVAPSA